MSQFKSTDLEIGDIIRIYPHPTTDISMRGERVATVQNIGRKWITIYVRKLDRNFRVLPENICEIF